MEGIIVLIMEVTFVTREGVAVLKVVEDGAGKDL